MKKNSWLVCREISDFYLVCCGSKSLRNPGLECIRMGVTLYNFLKKFVVTYKI
jgi:hypothetical protein